MKKTFFSYSFGCRVNEAEKEDIDRKMALNGFKFTKSKPDIFIINSCAVTNKAEREVRQLVYQTKKRIPKTKIVITGCSATYWLRNKLYQDLPVDLIVDNINKEFLVDIIKKRLSSQPPLDRSGRERVVGTSKFLDSERLLIKIQDGCQRCCSYCIVPYLRGLPKSYLTKNIVDKINKQINIKEVILTAVNTEAFGHDTGENLTQLVSQIINKTSIPRISFGSIHPWSIDKKFLNFYRKIVKKNRLINFFHIPLQSGSDKTLTLMKRGYASKDLLWKIKEIKKINSYAQIATDVIVGFLDESDNDFKETYRFLEKNPIDKFHVFRFSNRLLTAAFFMKKKFPVISNNLKIKRAKLLTNLSKKKYQQFLVQLQNINYRSQALFIDRFKNGYQQALLDNQVPAWIKINKRMTGEIKNVKINYLRNINLFGDLI